MKEKVKAKSVRQSKEAKEAKAKATAEYVLIFVQYHYLLRRKKLAEKDASLKKRQLSKVAYQSTAAKSIICLSVANCFSKRSLRSQGNAPQHLRTKRLSAVQEIRVVLSPDIRDSEVWLLCLLKPV